MRTDNDQSYYGRRAQQQLIIARAALDPMIKSIHLDLASRYATLSELAARSELTDGSIEHDAALAGSSRELMPTIVQSV